MLKKTVTAGVLAVGLVFASAGAASAHECFIPERSEQGNANSTHSQNWVTIHITELYSTAHEFLGGPALTPAQLDAAVAMTAEAGIPTSLTTFARGTLPKGKGVPESHSSDGKGIDHYFHTYESQLVGIFFAAQAL